MRNVLAVKYAGENRDPEGNLHSVEKLHHSASKQDLIKIIPAGGQLCSLTLRDRHS